ncbi:hypothetical protein F5X99DRAFT_427752 [Biscogniauxia marginata]|nr:hypothetical protein F5X99DRAFT_427752 [Biscogniauxia marginata]
MAPRKAPWEYSTNKNAVRARARKSKLTDYQRTVEQAKRSDTKAVSRAWKSVETEVMGRRRQKGIDAGSKIDRFMQRINKTGDTPIIESSNTTNVAPATPKAFGPDFAHDSELMFGPRQSSISMLAPTALSSYEQGGLGNTNMGSTNLEDELDATREQIRDLRRQTDALRNDIIIARSSLLSQEASLEELVGRIAKCEDASGFRQVIMGVHAMTDAAIKTVVALEGSSKNLYHANQSSKDTVKPDLAPDSIAKDSRGDN